MDTEKSRLLSLIEFSQQAARLRGKPPSQVSGHNLFSLYEHELRELPGLRLNVTDAADEIWLQVERLHETKPPKVESSILQPWVQMIQSPGEEPRLRASIEGATLIAAGTHCSEEIAEPGKPTVRPDASITLLTYPLSAQVHEQFTRYVGTTWRPWSEEEKKRRRTIRLYSQLFTLKQQLEGSIVEAQLELLWGAGIAIWSNEGTTLTYPLIGQLAELALNPGTSAIEIRPRDVDVRVEVDWFASVDNPGVGDFEKAAKQFFESTSITFSPFDRGTFEPILRTAVTNLDANGIYWPDATPPEDRGIPKPSEKLTVTDTWVLFARPRTNSILLQDLEKLKARAAEAEVYPPAIRALLVEPDTTNSAVELPSFRGMSATYHSDSSPAGQDSIARDLYFPKAFNDEQVRIVQLMDRYDGVVVQGPPGTGKTHTIANVICHYLAEGGRVLVTSMKDAPLAVLQDQLPEEIRPLAISLLTSEQEGMKQFEHAIQKIASEVQSLDRIATARLIGHLEESIDALHAKLANIDLSAGTWAKRNIAKVALDDEELDPQDIARELIQNTGTFEWLQDPLGIGQEYSPQFNDADVIRARDARRLLGKDIDYVGATLPQLIEFPDAQALLTLHQDLGQFERLKQQIEDGAIPSLANSEAETLVDAEALLAHIQHLEAFRTEVLEAHRPWTAGLRQRLRRSAIDANLLKLFETLGAELQTAAQEGRRYLERPISIPSDMEVDADLCEAVDNLALGKSAFGLKGLVGKAAQKQAIDSIRVLGTRPSDIDTWQFAAQHIAHLKTLRALALRWNALVPELGLEAVPSHTATAAASAERMYGLYLTVKAIVKAEAELTVRAGALFPTWSHCSDVLENSARLAELAQALRHHLSKQRLAKVWITRSRFQSVLEGKTGRVISEIQLFFSNTLGNPDVENSRLQEEWSRVMSELARVLGLGPQLTGIKDFCERVRASGAPQFSEALKSPMEGTVDVLLPDHWRHVWRLRRLATYIDSIDSERELKKLAQERRGVEADLARSYHDVVVKRTWLKLAENASHNIRAALQAYLSAIQKIGKGTGKRAVRYRHDARQAAAQANPAVPCWIMPHYRVSESLPAEIGCFDLVVIDEASQSDLTALPALLRAKKVLIVGDDKQVSPEGVGLEEEKVRSLMTRFLGNQVETYRPQMSPERSIYDLFKVVFALSSVMLKEHFRCVGPIIEYSKREFYNHELRPLRIPKASERLDPPLVDVLVKDGYRRGDVNLPEARFIVEEIKAISNDDSLQHRSIGVVSLLGDKQALLVWNRLTEEVGPEIVERHRIACGDARTFQGKERDIMFLSMVSGPNEIGAPLSRDTFAQRFNVAASRARDRMYLVRSVGLENLSEADKLRRSLITHFSTPFVQDETRVENLRSLCESPFERELYDDLTQRGFYVSPQVKVGQYRIDMVVEGNNDLRLAIECDGDKYHGPEKWAEDMQRQRVLERAGWVFWRCFASAFLRRRTEVLEDLLQTISQRGIEPMGAQNRPRSVHTEFRAVSVLSDIESSSAEGDSPSERAQVDTPSTPANRSSVTDMGQDRESPVVVRTIVEPFPTTRPHSLHVSNTESVAPPPHGQDQLIPEGPKQFVVPFSPYIDFSGSASHDPRNVEIELIAEGIVRIVAVEGPMIAKRAYDIYLRNCGIRRLGHEIKSRMNKALNHAIRQSKIKALDEFENGGYLFSTIRTSDSPAIKVRSRGSRTFEEIPPSEIQVVALWLVEKHGLSPGNDEHLRAILDFFDLKRLTTQVNKSLEETLRRKLPHVGDFMR